MKIKMESTQHVTKLDGVPARLWEGTTEAGVPCKVFVHRIAVHNKEDAGDFERELREQLQPGVRIDLRQIL